MMAKLKLWTGHIVTIFKGNFGEHLILDKLNPGLSVGS